MNTSCTQISSTNFFTKKPALLEICVHEVFIFEFSSCPVEMHIHVHSTFDEIGVGVFPTCKDFCVQGGSTRPYSMCTFEVHIYVRKTTVELGMSESCSKLL